MAKPTILTVDDDPSVSMAITRDLRSRYGEAYRVAWVTSGAEALDLVAELALKGRPVALIATDQRMPDMTGIELLALARQQVPEAKTLLLTAYADTDVAIRAINDIELDYYLLKPWDPPAERLYPVVDDLLDDWRQSRRKAVDVRVVGAPLVGAKPRGEDVPRAQPRAVPLARHRPGRRGESPAGRASRRGCR